MAEEQTPSPQRSTRLIAAIVVVLAAAIVIVPVALMLATPHFHGTVYDDPPMAADFELPRTDGSSFRLSDSRGDVVVLYFGYTHCPDVCPTTLVDLRRTVERLGDKAEDLEVVFITVDPERDDPERVDAYLSNFNPDFIGLVGEQVEIDPIIEDYGVAVVIEDVDESAAGYLVGHTSSMFVVDRAGRLRLRMHYGASAEDYARDLRYLLREKA
jgi:protein SCO1/2